MRHDSGIPKSVRAYLKRLGNPYASLQLEGFQDEVPFGAAHLSAEHGSASGKAAPGVDVARKPEQVDLFSQQSGEQLSPTNARSGNPYAALAQITEDEALADTADRAAGQDSKTASQTEFESGCRRVFAQYIPALERGRLRPEHRDFIARNRVRSGRIRFLLIQALQRYDLSSTMGLQPQFNRESELLTAKKLTEIERSVGTDE